MGHAIGLGPDDLARLERFRVGLNRLIAETGVALGICGTCQELRYFVLDDGVAVAFVMADEDHASPIIMDTRGGD